MRAVKLLLIVGCFKVEVLRSDPLGVSSAVILSSADSRRATVFKVSL